MLFGTEKEAREVMVSIFDRKNFADLNPEQMTFIKGLYLALDVLESYEERHCGEENEIGGILGEVVDEVGCKAVAAASEDIMGTIAELVVAFRDENMNWD